MPKPWKSIPRKSKYYEVIVSRDGETFFESTLITCDEDEAKGIFWALKREYPEKARFHVHLYEINAVRQLILGPAMAMDGSADGGMALSHAVDILKQVVGSNQTGQEALDILLMEASGIPGPREKPQWMNVEQVACIGGENDGAQSKD